MRYGIIVLWMLLCSITSAVAQVSVSIGLPGMSIGINLPVYPQLVRVPGYPVYYAPQLNSNYFFYDGMYWVYQQDNWYASSWYNGPWQLVRPDVVPLFVLRVPVRYYRHPPDYFRGWRADAPPRWNEHWGSDWERSHSGWNTWNRSAVPAPAPLPSYQRQYSGNRYPRAEQQQTLQSQHYRYQPRDAVVQQHYQAQRVQSAPASAPAQDQRGTSRPSSPQQGASPLHEDNRRKRVARTFSGPPPYRRPRTRQAPRPSGSNRSSHRKALRSVTSSLQGHKARFSRPPPYRRPRTRQAPRPPGSNRSSHRKALRSVSSSLPGHKARFSGQPPNRRLRTRQARPPGSSRSSHRKALHSVGSSLPSHKARTRARKARGPRRNPSRARRKATTKVRDRPRSENRRSGQRALLRNATARVRPGRCMRPCCRSVRGRLSPAPLRRPLRRPLRGLLRCPLSRLG